MGLTSNFDTMALLSFVNLSSNWVILKCHGLVHLQALHCVHMAQATRVEVVDTFTWSLVLIQVHEGYDYIEGLN